MFLNSFSNRFFTCVFWDYNYIIFINNKVLGVELLFNFSNSKECLTFIRQVSDLLDNDFSFLNNTFYLFIIIIKIFLDILED